MTLVERRGTSWAWSFGAAATLLAMLGSWIPSLWGDEAASVLSAQRPLPSLFAMLGHVDAVHGAYYLGLHIWVDPFGTSPFAVRVPPAIAVGLGAVAVVFLALRLGGRRVAILAGAVYCLLPRVTYMGEETRAYAFDAAIAAWTLLLLVDLLRGRRVGRRWWVVYGALVTLGIYTFLYMGLFVIVHALLLVAGRATRQTWRRWAVTSALALAVAAPVTFFSLAERSQVSFLSTQTTTDFASLAVGLWFSTWWVATAAWALILVAGAFWIRRLVVGRARPHTAGAPSLEVVAFAWLFVPGTLLLVSTLVVADFTGRYLSMSAPAAALAIAIGLDRLAARRLAFGIAATVLMVALCVPVYVSQRTPYAKNQSDWAEISATVGAHARAGQAVIFDESASPSRRPRLAFRTYPAGFRGLVDVTLKVPFPQSDTWYDRTIGVPEALVDGRLSSIRTVWLIEYATPEHTDTFGRADLAGAGYTVAHIYRTHRSEILELSKPEVG